MDWFRFHTHALNSAKVQNLPDFLFKAWVNMLCICRIYDGNLPDIKEIAFRLRCSEKRAKKLLDKLVEHKLIDDKGNGMLTMHDWREHQCVSDDAAERKRKQRDRDRIVPSVVTGHVTGQSRDASQQCPVLDQSRVEIDIKTFTPPIVPLVPFAGGPKTNAPDGACERNGIAVHKKPAGNKRTMAEIRKALGDRRLTWWEGFWSVFPCHKAPRDAADAYERKVHDYDLAVKIYHGAQSYARYALENPTLKLKYGQGWINGERWLDGQEIPRSQSNRPDFREDVDQEMLKNFLREGKPW